MQIVPKEVRQEHQQGSLLRPWPLLAVQPGARLWTSPGLHFLIGRLEGLTVETGIRPANFLQGKSVPFRLFGEGQGQSQGRLVGACWARKG